MKTEVKLNKVPNGAYLPHILNLGYDWVDMNYSAGKVTITVGMKSWFTSDLAQTVPLPSGKGATLLEAFQDLYNVLKEW